MDTALEIKYYPFVVLNDEEKIKSFDTKSGRYVLKSGSFETLINLSNEGPWMTLTTLSQY